MLNHATVLYPKNIGSFEIIVNWIEAKDSNLLLLHFAFEFSTVH